MKKWPPLPPMETLGCLKNKKMQTTELGTSEDTPFGTTFEINQPK